MKKNVLLFTLGNVDVNKNITKYTFSNSNPDPFTNKRSQETYDALIKKFNIKYWACARYQERDFSFEKTEEWKNKIQKNVLDYLEDKGEKIDFSIQMAGHPNIVQKHPYFILVDGLPYKNVEALDTINFPYIKNHEPHVHSNLYLNAKGVIVHTVVQRYMLINWVDGLNPLKVTTIIPGVDEEATFSSTKKEKLILWVGSDFEHKGGDNVIKAFQNIQKYDKEYKLVFVGIDKNFKEKNVSSIPFISVEHKDKLSDLYSRAKVFVMPSKKENTGLVYLEAMMHGTPVVVTKRGGLAETIRRTQTGVAVLATSIDEIEKGIMHIISDEKRYLEYSKRAYDFSQRNTTLDIYGKNVHDAIFKWLNKNSVVDDYTDYSVGEIF